MKFEHLFSPMQVGKVTYRNRIVSAPMAFGLIVQNPDARDFTYRKLEASAKGGNGCVIVGETDVNFTDAVRIPGFRPFDFAKPEEDPETFDAVGEYARRIKRHGVEGRAGPLRQGEGALRPRAGGHWPHRDHQSGRREGAPHERGRHGPHRPRLRRLRHLHAEGGL